MKAEQVRQCGELLAEFHGRFAPLFYEKRQAACAQKMLHGLLLDGVRATAAQTARAVPGAKVRSLQHFVGLSTWDHRPVVREHQAAVAEQLGHPEAVLACDGSAFPKKGDKSVAVARQWCGRLGKRENCQVGVFLAYVSPLGHTLVDEELYLPRQWTSDKGRRREAEIPEDVGFRTKPEIALERIRFAADGLLPFQWVSGDEEYGKSGDFRDGVDQLDLQFVLEVPCSIKVWTRMPPLTDPEDWQGQGRPPTGRRLSPDAPSPRRADELIEEATDWRKITVRQGAKKPIRSAWTAFRVHPWRDGLPGQERWLLIQHEGGDQYKYYLSNAGPDTALERMAQVATQEWFVEQCFREAKDEIGLDEFEVRKWRGWHHHMTMCMLAHAFLAIVRRRWKKRDRN